MTSYGFDFLFILFIWVLCFYCSAWWGSGWRCCQATLRRRYGDRSAHIKRIREYGNAQMENEVTGRVAAEWLAEGYEMPGCALPPIGSYGHSQSRPGSAARTHAKGGSSVVRRMAGCHTEKLWHTPVVVKQPSNSRLTVVRRSTELITAHASLDQAP